MGRVDLGHRTETSMPFSTGKSPLVRASASSTSLVGLPYTSLVDKLNSVNAVWASTPLVVAPACWNCGSNMQSEADCKALTKCRNCGGPHRSDSWDCQVRFRKSGPVTKEQLAWIRHLEQGKFAEAARARAAAKKAEEAIVAAAKDTAMAEATGFGVLGPEEEV